MLFARSLVLQVLGLILLLSFAVDASAQSEDLLACDHNFDGVVNADDIEYMVQKTVFGMRGQLVTPETDRFDQNGDHILNVCDIEIMLHKIAEFAAIDSALPPETCELGDLDFNGNVGPEDVFLFVKGYLHWAFLSGFWGNPGYRQGDVNGDGCVDQIDYGFIEINWTDSGNSAPAFEP